MFDEVKVVDYDNLLDEVKKRVSDDNKYINFANYFFEGCENYSYNPLSIDGIEEAIENVNSKSFHILPKDIDDYTEISEALIEILKENDISYRDMILVYVCW